MQFNSWIIQRKRAFVLFTGIGILLVSLAFLSVKILKSEFLAWVFLILVALLLMAGKFLFEYFFYKEVVIGINETEICINEDSAFSKRNVTTILFSELSWFSIEVINPKFYCITFGFKSGKKCDYSFPQDKLASEDDDASAMMNEINNKIIAFNKLLADSFEKVQLKPAFYATRLGLNFIIWLSVISIVLFIMHIIWMPKASFFWLIVSGFGIVQMIIKRRNSLSLFERFRLTENS